MQTKPETNAIFEMPPQDLAGLERWCQEGGTPDFPEDAASGAMRSVIAEFEQIARSLRSVRRRQHGCHREVTDSILQILEEKRTEVMSLGPYSPAIQAWRGVRDPVLPMILSDPRYAALRQKKIKNPPLTSGQRLRHRRTGVARGVPVTP